jgi:hypothetical protein
MVASSLRKLGPVPTTGVVKLKPFKGLGSVLLSRGFQSGKKLLGLGRNSLLRNREGRAETGVSIMLLLL